MSEAALEQLRERMKAAAAQIAALKREEKRHKQKEEDLLKILSHFVKTSHKQELVLLISRVLEQNLPANFILAIIILGNEEIERMAGKFILLQSAAANSSSDAAQFTSGEQRIARSEQNSSHALTFFKDSDDSLPLRIKIEVDNWIKNMLSQAEERPEKLLSNVWHIKMIELPKEYEFEDSEYREEREIKKVLVQLMTYVLRDFLEQSKISEPYDKLYNFCEFVITGILNKTQENFDNRLMLDSGK